MAPTGDTADSDGGIFNGLTFWLSLKVPLRRTLIGRVKANGGTVVEREKDAQMLIAERKDGIPGSYASAFLLDSLHEGRLVDKARYLKEPPPPSAVVSKPKATRTAFTQDDDAELIAWVLPHAEAGGKIRGNELYQDLEAKASANSRHTAQSWRDRFVKKYSDHTIAQLQAMLRQHQKGPAQPAQNLPPMALPALPGRAAPTSQSVQGTPPSASRQRTGPKSRARFTEDEDAALLEALRREPKPEKITEWFKEFAQKYPTHSWEAWYNHYKKIVVPRLRDTEPPEAQPSPRRGADPSSAAERGQAPSTPAKAPASSSAATRNPAPSTPANAQPPQERLPEDEEPGGEADDAERENFFNNLKIFMQAQGKRNNNVDFEPTAERQVVDLYQLYTIVDELDTDIDPSEFTTSEWAEVATLMGLDCSKRESVARKMGKIWDVYLQDFYKSLEPDEEEEDDQEQEDPSPRPLLGRKRSLEPEPELPLKRRHRSRDEEIAATPVTNARRGEKPMTSPSLAAGAPTPSLPSRHHPANEDVEDNITPSQQLHDEEAEVTPIPIQLDGPSSRRRSNRSAPESPIASREDSEPPAQDDGVAELASQVERFQALGYSAVDVKTALRATTLDIGLAGYVMEHYLRQKKKLPTNVEGVWTERDDDGLRFVDGLPSRMGAGDGEDEEATRRRRENEWARLVEKHTQDRIETRREYLELASEVVRS